MSSSLDPRRRWLLLVAGWSVFGIVQALMMTVLGRNAAGAVMDLFGFYIPLALLWALFTPVIGWWGRIIRARYSSLLLRIVGHIPLLIIAMLIQSVARRVLVMAFGQPVKFPFGVTFLYFADVTIASYLVAVWAARALDAYDALRERTARALALEAQLATAQMEYLKLQLRPHFLFNTLSSVAELGHEAPASAARMLGNVIALLESAVARQTQDFVSLGDELQTLSHYLAIERLRFSDWIVIDEDIDDAARDALVPPFVLQPLAENAVQHGLAGRTDRGHITVRASVAADRLRIAIIDNGVGLSAPAYRSSHGVGLSNVRARLDSLYGSTASLTLEEKNDQGTVAALELPMRFAPLEPVDSTSATSEAASVAEKNDETAFDERDRGLIALARRRPVVAAGIAWTVIAMLRIQHSYVYMIYRDRFTTSAFKEGIRYDIVGATLWLALTPFVFWLGRKVPLRRQSIALRIAAHSAIASTIAFGHLALTRVLAQSLEIPLFSAPSSQVYAWSVTVYVILVVMANFGEIERWIRERDAQAARLQNEIEAARFHQAMLELRPAILLDALRNLEATIASDPVRAERSLAEIGEFLRLTLDLMNRRELTVAEECESLRAYVRLLSITLAPELAVDLVVPSSLSDEVVPNGVLRALLDSLLAEQSRPGGIRIELVAQHGSLILKGSIPGDPINPTVIHAGPLAAYEKQGLIRDLGVDDRRIHVFEMPQPASVQ